MDGLDAEPAPGRPPGPRGRPRSPTRTHSPVDRGAFPDAATRLAIDDGAASARFRELLDQGGPILADGAMGTMLFSAGLQFGDPPEVWNLAHPDVVRRIQRGYLEAGSQIVMTNTFGGNRLRLGLHGLPTASTSSTGPPPSCPRRGPCRRRQRARGRRHRSERRDRRAAGHARLRDAVDVFREQAASLVAGGVDLIWIETMSDLNEIKAAIEGVRRASAGIALVTTMTFDTRGFTMMGVSPEEAVEALVAWGADAVGGNCGNGPDELLPVIERMHAAAPDVDPRRKVERRHARARRHAGRLQGRRGDDGRLRDPDARRGRVHRRGVLRQYPGPPARDGRGAPAASAS